METLEEPKLILVFSGKRKSGKDYVTDLIHKRLCVFHFLSISLDIIGHLTSFIGFHWIKLTGSGKPHSLGNRLGPDACCILRLSGPLKQQYALEHSLDFGELLGASEYKEKYRADMIQWGERRREQDPGFFCRLATRGAQQPVWMISDARRLSDLQWFWREYPSQTRCVRVHASQQTRVDRGWVFTAGIDDAESECGLDSNVEFDWTIRNEADAPSLNEQLQSILSLAETAAGLKQTNHFITSEH